MLDREANVHVADFGIASATGMDSLTMTGTVLGTAAYLSPEQAQGDRATPASDRYALAVVAFELLTGERPFTGDSPTAEAVAHVHAPVPSVHDRESSLPGELDPVFRIALAKDPSARYSSAGEFVAALRAAFAEAAGATRELAAAAPIATAATRRFPSPQPAWRPPVSPMSQARRRSGLPLIVGLILLGAVAGGVLAYLLTRSDRAGAPAPQPSATTVVRTVTRASGETTTVQRTVTTTPSAPSTAAPSGASGQALNDAGYAKMQAGDFAGALPLLQQSVQKLGGVGFPYEAYANYNLGYTLLQLGRCGDAIPYLQRAKQLEPSRKEPKDAIKQAERCA